MDSLLGLVVAGTALTLAVLALLLVPLLRRGARRLAVALAVVVPILALGGYLLVGSPESVGEQVRLVARLTGAPVDDGRSPAGAATGGVPSVPGSPGAAAEGVAPGAGAAPGSADATAAGAAGGVVTGGAAGAPLPAPPDVAAGAGNGEGLPQFQPRTRSEADLLAQQLQLHLKRKPRDARAWVLLARMRGSLDQFAEAVAAYEQAMAASAKVAKDPQVLAELADALGMAQGGKLAGRPRELAEQALLIDPRHPKALDIAGSAALEADEPAVALKHWQALLATLPERSQERAELAVAVDRLRRRAGISP